MVVLTLISITVPSRGDDAGCGTPQARPGSAAARHSTDTSGSRRRRGSAPVLECSGPRSTGVSRPTDVGHEDEKRVRAARDDAYMPTEHLRIPAALRDRARQIIDVTDAACREHLDDEYGRLAGELVGRLARKRPSPLVRGDATIWAAGVIYALGQVNFLFD